jgi:hypothetical protein
VGDTGKMKGVFRKTLYAIFGKGGIGFFGTVIHRRVLYDLKGAEGILETLNGLGETTFGIGIGLMAKL